MDDMQRNIFTQAYRDLHRLCKDATLVPIWMGTSKAAGNQQKHLSLSFCNKSVTLSFEELKSIKTVFFSNARTAKFPEICHFFNQYDRYRARHVNVASPKSLEIQA